MLQAWASLRRQRNRRKASRVRRALDPSLAEASEELADYHDAIRDGPRTAMSCWEKAEALRGQTIA
jgi:hypothetical protein